MAANKLQRELRRLGKYELSEKLGGGGCGTVYKGRDTGTGEVVAVKVLKPELAMHELLIKRFEQEFLATRVLDNPHIVRALDFRSEEHTSELQSPCNLVCRLLLEKKNNVSDVDRYGERNITLTLHN